MSVIVEFTIATADFVFGTALATVEEMRIELESIVPTGGLVVPYFWATGEDFAAFERHVRDDPNIENLVQLDRVGDTALYRTEWSPDLDGLMDGLTRTSTASWTGSPGPRRSSWRR